MANWKVGAATRLPIVARDKWVEDTVVDHLRAWAAREDGTIDAARMRRAFLLYDAEADGQKPGHYRLPIADAVDGKLTAVNAAVVLADNRLARQGLDAKEAAKARQVLNGYLARMRHDGLPVSGVTKEQAWDRLASAAGEFQAALAALAEASGTAANLTVELGALAETVADDLPDDGGEPDAAEAPPRETGILW